jgi:hypothetical protein
MAVILGEAIWGLIVSVMNNVVVPWLGDLFGQSSGLPTSFTQRPYNYPELFVSVLELCIAGLVAAIINYFFQRPRAGRMKPVTVPAAPVETIRVVPQAAPDAVQNRAPMTQVTMTPTATTPVAMSQAATQATLPVAAPAPVTKPDPVTPAAPVAVAPASSEAALDATARITRPVEVASPAPQSRSP